ncbi:MAG: hypothetical protein ACT4OS_07270 [Acidimicrobiales bacterium]
MTTVAVLAGRLSPHDGVSVEAAKWVGSLRRQGFSTFTVAGAGSPDRLVAGLDPSTGSEPDRSRLAAVLADADVVVVENLLSLPLHLPAAEAVTRALTGRPAILHHHDLVWQRPYLNHLRGWPPDDDAWAHVTINHRSRRELAAQGFAASTIHNCFDTEAAPGRRSDTRQALGVDEGERLLLHPTRAIPRKNVPAALALAGRLGAVYWLLGPAEDGYGEELDSLLEKSSVPVRRGLPPGFDAADAYAAAEAVTLPSTWEGFGNATVESAIFRRPLAIGSYPVAAELAAFGFRWFPLDEPERLNNWLSEPEPALLDGNLAVARRHFSLDRLDQQISTLLSSRGWSR